MLGFTSIRASKELIILTALITMLLAIAIRMSTFTERKVNYPYYVPPDDYNDFPERQEREIKDDDMELLSNEITTTFEANEENDLVSLATKAADKGTVIMLYASYSYRQPLFNWLVAARKARKSATKGVLLVCLDEGLRNLVRKLGWNCYLEIIVKAVASEQQSDDSVQSEGLNKDTVKSLWVSRVEHVDKILNSGLNVVLTDTDAIWLKDPLAALLTSDYGDVIGSRANFPYASPWGTTLCMGFVIFRSSDATRKLAKIALVETKITQDDQIGFNNVLFKLPFEDTTGKKLAFGRRLNPAGTATAHATFYIEQVPLKVSLIQHNWIPRYCAMVDSVSWQANVLVAHCHVNEGKPAPTSKHKGNQESHTAILAKYGVYFLRADWDEVINSAASSSNVGKKANFESLVQSLGSTS